MWFWVTNLLTWPNFFQVHPCCSLKPFFVLFFFQIIFHCIWIHNILFIHSSTAGHSAAFRFGAVIAKTLWTFTPESLCRPVFYFSWVYTSSGTRSHTVQFSSVQSLSHVQLHDPMDCSTPGFPVYYQLPQLCANSCASNWWCHPTVSSSVIPFSSKLDALVHILTSHRLCASNFSVHLPTLTIFYLWLELSYWVGSDNWLWLFYFPDNL